MTSEHGYLDDSIERAAETVGSVWPLHSFVTANPLAGFEDRPFHVAVAEAEATFDGRGYPHPSVFRRAWEAGRIDPEILAEELDAHGVDGDPEALLDEMAAAETEREAGTDEATEARDATGTVDRVVSKWLGAFLDEGQAEWPMPNREDGFYAAWRTLAPHDGDVPCDRTDDLPETPTAALEAALSDVPERRWEAVFEHHLAALPGWTGFVKRRVGADADPWQDACPITLTDYLAVRLTLADLYDAPIVPEDGSGERTTVTGSDDGASELPLPEIWLTAWERCYRQRVLDRVDDSVTEPETASPDGERPAAQLVFCIDTRSEVIRRHVEAVGPYETHGYAGFFGVPMRYRGYDAEVDHDACPPVVDPEHRVVDRPAAEVDAIGTYDRWRGLVAAGRKHLKALKTNVAAAFTFVEGAGGAYGAAMASRTLVPAAVHDALDAVNRRTPSRAEVTDPDLDPQGDGHDHGRERDHTGGLPHGMTLEEKVGYAKTAFDLMGWEAFARLVVFTGHASSTANNPFDSSLDCGACAGNPGGPNARVLAAICNDPEVRAELREAGHHLPEDTVFLAAEHDTTTDEVTLFDGDVPESHSEDVERLREDLEAARRETAAERAESMPTERDDPVRDTERRSVDWAETRPEWGLAGNASFVVGPRDLTEGRDLDGRAFLHSYDWTTDPDGDALAAIFAGPLVVTQWINCQYYFSTVDNATFGSGSKVTQNPVGNVGVYQGNGGDIMTGLPLQSLKAADDLPYHQPIRLSAVVHAPTERVAEILRERDEVRRLLDNGWLRLTVMDPTRDNETFHYQGDLEWEPSAAEAIAPEDAGSVTR